MVKLAFPYCKMITLKRLFLYFVLFISFSNCNTKDNTSTSDQDFSYKLIFNGIDLDGWEASPDAMVQIDSSVLHISNNNSGRRGFLLTEKTYQNFQLKFDFLCPPSNNSGLMLRYNSLDNKSDAYNGYEINIFNVDDTQNPTGSIMNLSRSFYPDNFNPNTWNHMEITAQGDYISVSLNGIKVNEIHDRRSLTGKIGFLTNTGKLRHMAMFKNIEIKNMPGIEALPPQIEDVMRTRLKKLPNKIFNGVDLSDWEIVGDGTWLVQDGQIIGRTNKEDFSFLRYKKAYKNFYLKLKFNISKEHNSGVFIRQNLDSTNININTGLEVNIYDHNGFSYAWPTGSIVTKARSFIGLVDYDEWNIMEIFAFDKHICVYVNGIKSTEYYTSDEFNNAGNICLQVGVQLANEQKGGSEVIFRDMEVIEFEDFDKLSF